MDLLKWLPITKKECEQVVSSKEAFMVYKTTDMAMGDILKWLRTNANR